MNESKEDRKIKWKERIQKHIEKNKLILLFMEDEVVELLINMEIVHVELFPGPNSYKIRIGINKNNAVVLEHYYSIQTYHCDIKIGSKTILTDKDKKLIYKLFSSFGWFDMYQDISRNDLT